MCLTMPIFKTRSLQIHENAVFVCIIIKIKLSYFYLMDLWTFTRPSRTDKTHLDACCVNVIAEMAAVVGCRSNHILFIF